MKKSYPKNSSNPDFPKIEESVLKFWEDNNIFQKSIDNRPKEIEGKNNEYIFYDGPPFANGLPHYGHLLTGYKKDMVARYQTILGKKVERRFGWDCHGLPAEMATEKELKISGRSAIMNYGVDKFNDYCRESVLKYTNEWQEYVTRQARWVDFKNDYKTMDVSYMESVIWAFKELYKKGLIYQSMRVMPYSWACETPLSNFETKLDNAYRQRADKAVTIAFTLKKKPAKLENIEATCKILAWTTTPWTLPSNLALAISDKIDYAYVIKNNECLIIAKTSVDKYLNELGLSKSEDVDGLITAYELMGIEYEPLFPYFKDHENAFKILKADFVTEGDGTGVVHIAPGFGEDDQILCNEHNIELVCPIDSGGKFTNEITEFSNIQVFEANDLIIKHLKISGGWIKTEQYIHNYPHCWRTDTPLIYKAVPSWYVNVTKFKDKMVSNNQQINWIPSHIKDGLFGKWLENARDWSISRNRFWGTPIPVWISNDPKYQRIDVYGSIKELQEDFNVEIKDLHKPYIDNLTRPNPNDPSGKSMMVRVDDVFDCWFESGSMPFAQVHYPFENKEWFESHFPADFIAEYIAQTRGWFYTLIVLSTALFDKPPFLNCVCHGVILDENGQKLSKRLNNYADPMDLFKIYGSDALRFLMMSSNVMKGEEFLIDKDGAMVRDTLRIVIKPIWNAYNFFTLYANSDKIRAKSISSPSNILDIYILSKLKITIGKIKVSMDAYDPATACSLIESFFEVLNNWYIRRSRSRFWKKEKDTDKQEAYDTLFTVIDLMCRSISPILPLISEEIYKSIHNDDENISVHLTDYPQKLDIEANYDLIYSMDKIREICSLSLAIRNDENIRTRLPLNNLTIIGENLEKIYDYESIIKEEVNVKNINFSSEIEANAKFQLQINFPVLGKRLPSKIKQIINAAKKNEWSKNEKNEIVICENILNEDEAKILLLPINQKNSRSLSKGDGLVTLDLEITKELYDEGLARDLVRIIQQMRKDMNLDISDKIFLNIQSESKIIEITKKFEEYISSQCLSKILYESNSNISFKKEFTLDNILILISIETNNDR